MSDILATIALALLLSGVNEHNPHQYLCLLGAAVLAWTSYKIGGSR